MNRHLSLCLTEFCLAIALAGCSHDNLEPNTSAGASNTDVPVQSLAESSDTLIASSDALLRSAAKNSNNGTSSTIPVKVLIDDDDGEATLAIVKFDQASIAAVAGSGILHTATLEFAVKESGTGSAGNDIDVRRVLKPWTEAGVTWKCGEDLNTSNVTADCPTTGWKIGANLDAFALARTARTHLSPGQTGIARFDVTGDVQAFLAGTTNNGWVLHAASATSRALLWSRESASKPRLVLSVTPATPVKLAVVIGSGVIATTPLRDTTYTSGAVVTYGFSAAPGYQNVAALLDTILVPAAGTITMNGDHALLVTADTVLNVDPADQPIFDGLRALLTAADPVAAYEAHLARVDALYRAVGIEEASRRLNVVGYLAVDPVRDEAALRRVDAALANHVFDLPNAPGPAGSLRRAGLSAATAQAVSTISDSVTFFFVNGIFNDDQRAADATASVRLIVENLAGLLPNIRVRHFYNRTHTDQGGGLAEREARCMAGAARALEFVDIVTAIRLFADCAGRTVADLLHTLDGVEAIRQWLSVSGTTSPSLETDAIALANALQAERDQGSHVIAVPHSQGNLMVQQAVGFLRNNGRDSANSAPCFGAVSLAAPTSANWPHDPDKLQGAVVKGDAILLLPHLFPLLGSNEFPQMETALSRKADQQVALVALLNPGIGALLRAYWSIRLHDAVDSYLTQPESRDLIQSSLLSVYQSCAVGFVGISPELLFVFTGGTGQLTGHVSSQAGYPLSDRKILWSSSNPGVAEVDSAGAVRGLAAGTTTITARVGAVSATATVQVVTPGPPVPSFRSLTGIWEATVPMSFLIFNPGAPPRPGNAILHLDISLSSGRAIEFFLFPGDTEFGGNGIYPIVEQPLGAESVVIRRFEARYDLTRVGDDQLVGTYRLDHISTRTMPITLIRVSP